MQYLSEDTTDIFYEAVIREQLRTMLPKLANIDIVLCAHLMSNQIKGFQTNPNFNGGKC